MVFDKVWQLRRHRKHIDKAYAKDIRDAKNGDDRQCVEHQAWDELNGLDEEIEVALTHSLQERARNLDIPIPSSSEFWRTSRVTGAGFLQNATRLEIEQQIRKETKERRDLQLGLWKDILLLVSGAAAFVQLIRSLWKH